MSAYRTSPIKQRTRRTHGQMASMLSTILEILNGEENQITIRHLFYRLASERQVIQKEEKAYKSLCGHLSKWRRSGDVPWDSFSDSTRWHIRRRTFDSVDDALETTVNTYRRNLWETQEAYVEIWTEKDAVASILAEAARPFGVPVFICRGFASLSSLYDAAGTFREAVEAGKRPVIYHFGDFDPSGVAAGDAIMRTFRKDFDIDVEFVRSAVTAEQIEEHGLPTRPVKKSDTRSAKWGEVACVEIDTMKPSILQGMVKNCIVQHIDQHEWEIMRRTEAMERETLKAFSVEFQQREAQ